MLQGDIIYLKILYNIVLRRFFELSSRRVPVSILNYVIDKIKEEIPEFVLEQAFFSQELYRTRIPVTVDTRIQELVIQKTVLPDINVIGGTTIYVPLHLCEILERDYSYTVIRVPPEAIDNQHITSVLEVVTPGTGLGNRSYMTGGSASQVGAAAQQQLQSMTTMNNLTSGKTMLINTNTVMVEGPYQYIDHCMLKVTVGHDALLSSIDHRNSLAFAELVILAVKAYIYNKNVIAVDQGMIQGGSELGSFARIVGEYSDAREMYKERLKTSWAKVDKLNDHDTRNRLISLMVGRPM